MAVGLRGDILTNTAYYRNGFIGVFIASSWLQIEGARVCVCVCLRAVGEWRRCSRRSGKKRKCMCRSVTVDRVCVCDACAYLSAASTSPLLERTEDNNQ